MVADREAWRAAAHGVAKNRRDRATEHVALRAPAHFHPPVYPEFPRLLLNPQPTGVSAPPRVTSSSLLRPGPPDVNVPSVTPSTFTLPPSALLARSPPCPLLFPPPVSILLIQGLLAPVRACCSCWSRPSHPLPLALSLCVHTRACYPSFPRTLRRLSPTLTGPCAPLGPSFHRKITICIVSRHTLNPLHHGLDCFHVHSSETVFLKATPEAASQTCSRCHHSGTVPRRAPPLGLNALELASSSY